MTLEAHEVRAGAELHCSPDPVDVMVNKYLNDTYCVLKNSAMRDFEGYRIQRLVLAPCYSLGQASNDWMNKSKFLEV